MIDALIHRIQLHKAEIQVGLAQGVSDWNMYLKLVGEHNGLQRALDMIDNLLDEEKNQD